MGNRESSTEDDDVESGRVPTSVELMSSSNATDSSHVEIVTSNQQPGLSVITGAHLRGPNLDENEESEQVLNSQASLVADSTYYSPSSMSALAPTRV